jgi:hypothetical protein
MDVTTDPVQHEQPQIDRETLLGGTRLCREEACVFRQIAEHTRWYAQRLCEYSQSLQEISTFLLAETRHLHTR